MQTDRELLELAARAAGLDLEWCDSWKCMAKNLGVIDGFDRHTCWNPLKDDGDALRLAVKLRMVVSLADCMCCAVVDWHDNEDYNEVYVRFSESFKDRECDNAEAATRRAIVRAAVQMSKKSK